MRDTGLDYSLLRADDANLLAAGLQRVYGDSYPIREFYDPHYVADLIGQRKLFTVVARNDGGEVVAQMSTVLEQAGDVTADGSALMVDSNYRGLGVTANLGRAMGEVYRACDLSGLHLYALALHDRVQRQSGQAGAVVTGVLPAWFSRDARVDGYPYPEGRRIGAVCLYMPLAPLPARKVFLPKAYAEYLRGIYQRLPAQRELCPSPPAPDLPRHSQLRTDHKPGNGHRRLVVNCSGNDLPMNLAQLCSRARDNDVQYLDLSLLDPNVDLTVQLARDMGFFFGALMVDRCGADFLRLQRYHPALTAPEAMVTASVEAAELLALVSRDLCGA